MSRDGIRLIRTQIPDIFTAARRDDELNLPVWHLDGPAYESESGPWAPEQDYIIITGWYVQAGSQGTGNTTFSILVGDNLWYPQGGGQIRRQLTLGATDMKAEEEISTTFDHIIVSNRNWLKLACSVGGGHENCTVQLYGRVM
ncbi:MAG: hypothetical protein EBU08_00305 [Micrococcales bacterium]|nr:hypothetical protein [Micrococcales bacterium]